jgi:hypothetical protein
MADSIPLASHVQTRTTVQAIASTESIPWYIWSCLMAVICSVIGGAWDISWHESVGRDTFWTTPHILIQLCGVLSGISCGYLILSTTFQKNLPLRAHSISLWGFRGPMGAFMCAWGGVAMITSAPFDNWWHSAYGLDVKILSPPHVLLALGMTAIRFGTLVMILSEMNRAQGEHRAKLERLVFLAFIFMMGMTIGIAQEYTFRFLMHGAMFYLVVALVAPIWMAAVGAASKHPWAATIMTTMYTAMHLCLTWLLPLFTRGAQARPGLSKNYASRPAGFSVASDRASDRFRSAAPPSWRVEQMGQSSGVRRGIPGQLSCGSVAIRGFSDVAGFAQLDFRNQQLSLFCTSRDSLGAQHLRSHGTNPRRILDAHGHRAGHSDTHDQSRTRLGRMDAEDSQVNRKGN